MIKQDSFRILLLALMLIVGGCSSLRKNAAELLEQKEYGDALNLYEQILKTEPNDAEALSGRTKSRIGLIQKELIEVRFLRLSGQQLRANETLLQILGRVKDWSLYPDGPVAFTQFEEMSYASRAVEKDVEDALEKRRPFRAVADLQRWGSLFPAERTPALGNLKVKTQRLGQEQCVKWRDQNGRQPYFARFLWKSCGLWNQPEMDLPEAPELFSWMEPQLRWFEARPDPALETELVEKLQAAFRDSPWFDVHSSQVALAKVEPKYTFRESRTAVQLVHGYVIAVPYDSKELVETTQWVPDDHTESVRDATGNYRTEVIRKTRMVSRKDLRTITRMRDEVRSIPYAATRIEIEAQLDFDLRFNDAVFEDARKNYTGREDELLVQHTNDSPEVRLRPQSPRIPSAGETFAELTQKLTKEFSGELNTLWRRNFCRAPKSTQWSQVSENVHKCLYGAGDDVPDYAEQWLVRELGVTSAEYKLLTQGVVLKQPVNKTKLRTLSSSSETLNHGP